MTEPTKNSLRDVFNEAIEILDATERAQFVRQACGNDVDLIRKVEDLLRAHEQVGGVLDRAASAAGQKVTALSSRAAEKTGDRIGRYKLVEQIGEGGCGVVYRAEQEEPVRRTVALKVIKPGMDTNQVIARFEAERQALALLDHPNIAKVFDAGATETGRPYFVMELVTGVPITEYCDQHNLSTSERLRLFGIVCHAIEHAHQKGIIHRDIKPSNVMVTRHNPAGPGIPKVIDFGIAKATTDQRLSDKTVFTSLEQFIGTPAYMSPEQAERSGVDIDTRTDIYSLGVVLYELLTGRPPFDAEELRRAGLDEIRRTIREQEPAKPSTRLHTLTQADLTTVAQARRTDAPKLVDLVQGDLDWIVMKCLEKDRNRRYETVNALGDDLQRHLADEIITARPPTTAYRFGKLLRRNRLAFAAGSCIMAALLIGLALTTWQAVRATRAEHEAQENARAAKTEAAKSRQVAQFMRDMLKAVGPSVALGRDTAMLREILDTTEERLDRDLTGQPEAEAELRNTLGRVYRELGAYEKSEELLRKALDSRRKLSVSDPSLVAGSLEELAGTLLMQGKLSEAKAFAREALEICRKSSDNGQVTADALHLLGMVLTRGGNLVEAEPLHREALSRFRKIHGAEHREVAGALTELAHNQQVQGRLSDSEALYREGLALQRKLLGNEHPDVSVSLMSLGSVVEQGGKFAEAETLYRECLAMQRKLIGNDHPNLAATLQLLIRSLGKAGKTEEAKTFQAEIESLWKKRDNSGESAGTQVQFEKGVLLLQQGKAAEAEILLRAALAGFEKQKGSDDPAAANPLCALADALVQQHRWAEAEEFYRKGLAVLVKSGRGDQHPTPHLRFQLGAALRQQGKLGEAEMLLREAADLLRKLIGTDHPAVAYAWSELAQVLEDQGKPGDAELIAEEAVAMLRKSPGNSHPKTADSLAHLARIRLRQDRHSEAEPLLRECVSIREKKRPADERTFDAISMLGESLLGQKKYVEAEPLLRSGYEGMQQVRDPLNLAAPTHVKDALTRLVRLYEGTEQLEKAAEWHEKLAAFESAANGKKAAPPK